MSEEMAEDSLRDFFASAESVAGLKSIHGALIDMAQSGASGTRSPTSPEDRWYDARAGQVRRHAATVRALERLTSEHVAVLFAFYGEPGWPGSAPDGRDDWHRASVPPDVRRTLGPALGRVALLTTELGDAAERWEGRDARPQTVLVALCKAYGRSDGENPLSPITKAAEALHGAALVAFGAASGQVTAPRPRGRRRVSKWQADIKPVRMAV